MEASFLPPVRASKTSKLKSGSYLDDDSLEIIHKPSQTASKFMIPAEHRAQSPKLKSRKVTSKNGNAKRIPTTIEKMYDSLRNANREQREESHLFDHVGPQVSINVGREMGFPESTDSQNQHGHPQDLHTFDIATGSINHGHRSINYTVQEILGTCFAINLVVPATEQSWMVFVPSSETILELLRIWKQRTSPEHMNKLCTWLLSCITLEFDEMLIVAAHFNHTLFQKCYTQEIIDSVQNAAVKIQSTMRRYLSNKHLRIRLLKAKQIQESRVLAAMRVKAIRRAREKSARDAGLRSGRALGQPSVALSSAFDNNAELLASVKQVLDDNQHAQPPLPAGSRKKRRSSPKKGRGSKGVTVADPTGAAGGAHGKHLTPHSPGGKNTPQPPPSNSKNNPRKKTHLKSDNRGELATRAVTEMKHEFDGALNSFQTELDSLRTQLVSQQRNAGDGVSRGASRQAPYEARTRSADTEERLAALLGSTDVDFMKQEISALLGKIGSLEDHLAAQRIANERSQEIAKLEILSAKLEAESAVERAAARVRNETIAEISSQMREIEKERARQEEEKAQKDLLREEAMRREIERKQSHMSEVLKQELFKQQLLQQQEQAALLQRQQDLQDKLHKQQLSLAAQPQSPIKSVETTGDQPGSAHRDHRHHKHHEGEDGHHKHHHKHHKHGEENDGKHEKHKHSGEDGHHKHHKHRHHEGEPAARVDNEQVTLLPPGQQLQSPQKPPSPRSAPQKAGSSESSVRGAESVTSSVVSSSSSRPKPEKKSSWNWLLFGGGSTKYIAPKPETPVIPAVVTKQQVEDVKVEKAPEPTISPHHSVAEAEPEPEPVMAKEEVETGPTQEELQQAAAKRIQRASLNMVKKKKFGKTENFAILRAESLEKLLEHTKDEAVVNNCLSSAMEMSNSELAAKTVHRLNNLVAKYDKSGVLFPADYDLLVAFLRQFGGDEALIKKGLDILNVALKLQPERFDGNDQALTDMLMQTIDIHKADPLLCFKVTRCIYRMCEKSADNRVSFGQKPAQLGVLRLLFEMYLKNPSVVENVMKCVINLCIDCPANQDALNQLGLCDCVFFAFMEHLKVERLFYLICRAMVNMCANNHAANQQQFAKGIYPNIFIKAVMLYKSNPRAIEQVITCILAIVANNKANKVKFQEAGLCEVLLDLVRISESQPSILTNCFWALSNLTSVANPARKALHAKILETLRRYEEDESSPELSRHAKTAMQRIFRSASAHRAATPITSLNVVGSAKANANIMAAPAASAPTTVNGDFGQSGLQVGHARLKPTHKQPRLEGFTESVISELSM